MAPAQLMCVNKLRTALLGAHRLRRSAVPPTHVVGRAHPARNDWPPALLRKTPGDPGDVHPGQRSVRAALVVMLLAHAPAIGLASAIFFLAGNLWHSGTASSVYA